MSNKVVRMADAAATAEFAKQVAAALPADLGGWSILLQGELGAGKSTFARALLRNFGFDGAVPSPTYTLVEPYEVGERVVYHIDLYRIAAAEELDFLGWSDMQDGLKLIEWPERVPSLMQGADAILKLAYDGTGRTAEFILKSDRAQQCLNSAVAEPARS